MRMVQFHTEKLGIVIFRPAAEPGLIPSFTAMIAAMIGSPDILTRSTRISPISHCAAEADPASTRSSRIGRSTLGRGLSIAAAEAGELYNTTPTTHKHASTFKTQMHTEIEREMERELYIEIETETETEIETEIGIEVGKEIESV